MKRYRYKVSRKVYILIIFSLVTHIIWGTACLIFLNDEYKYLSLVPFVIVAVQCIHFSRIVSEKYIIDKEKILTFGLLGKQKRRIDITEQPIVLISHADYAGPMSVRTASSPCTFLLKGKYSINLLWGLSVEEIAKFLHKKPIVDIYTNSMIPYLVHEYYYLYSFVGDSELMDYLITTWDPMVIIPESLKDVVKINAFSTKVFIDNGY